MAMSGCAARSRASAARRPPATSISASRTTRRCWKSVIWKTTFNRMRVKPEEGLDVVVTGRLTTFAGSSKYQIVIDTLEPAGVGALMALLEERKKKLAAEGLFDEARKQLLPFLPRGDRRRDLADRRGHPRHPASARRPLPAPRPGLAGESAGRKLGRRSRRRHRQASMRCRNRRRDFCRGGPISSSSRAAAARSKICGRSTRKSWCGQRPQASFR